MARLVMIAGASRSGKSAAAEERLRRCSRVAYLATLEAGDPEMRRRVEIHRRRRPASWETVEVPRDLAGALRGRLPDGCEAVLVDCLTGYLSNRLLDLGMDPEGETAAPDFAPLLAELDTVWRTAKALPLHEVAVVTNEVGAGVVPPSPLGRAFRDLAGWANQRLAAAADEVFFLQFGLRTRLK